jgi:hypothetical protein
MYSGTFLLGRCTDCCHYILSSGPSGAPGCFHVAHTVTKGPTSLTYANRESGLARLPVEGMLRTNPKVWTCIEWDRASCRERMDSTLRTRLGAKQAPAGRRPGSALDTPSYTLWIHMCRLVPGADKMLGL